MKSFKEKENSNLHAILSYLDDEQAKAIAQISSDFLSGVQEIRLRSNSPLVLSCVSGDYHLSQDGEAIKVGQASDSGANIVKVSRNALESAFLNICQHSIHTHQAELVEGFVTSIHGCRVGVAGSAVINGREVTSIRDLTSLCIRISRNHKNCSKSLIPSIVYENRVLSTLICGEPSSGKTSLLKDLARNLSTGLLNQNFSFRVSIIDERGELSTGQDDALSGCDVLKYYPKAKGIEQAVRCLAPEVIIFDEMGTAKEVESVIESLNSGVSVITTAHCTDLKSLKRRPQLVMAIKSGAFEQIVFLKGRKYPGEILNVVKIEGSDFFD